MSAKKIAAIKAVSFDLDDTFWDCDPVIVKAEQTLSAWLEDNYPASLQGHSSDSLREMRASVIELNPHLVCDVTEIRKAILKELMKNENDPHHASERAFDVFYRARSEVTLYTGTHELLESLNGRYKLAAITNGNADLDIIGLSHFFDDVQRAELNNAPKPQTAMFDRCCSNLQIDASELMHVGDNPQTDVQGAHNAGAVSVWFNQHGMEWPENLRAADIEVRTLSELQQLLAVTA